jgi:hypothetical protein
MEMKNHIYRGSNGQVNQLFLYTVPQITDPEDPDTTSRINGFASLPLEGRPWPVGSKDGVVIDSSLIAGFRNDKNPSVRLKGTTVVHELGHWFGLYQ